MRSEEITNSEDIIDSRDVISRIDYLESWLEGMDDEELEDYEDEKEELENLKALQEEGEFSPDWQYGETLIHEDYFKEYCRDLIQDIGDLPSGIPPYIEGNIDWDGVANDLKVDYNIVDFDGVSYYIRA